MRASSHKHRFAKALRSALSPPEVRIWVRLRERIPGRPIFRRQHPIGPYIADFYCPVARLVVEIDGEQHRLPDQAARDAARDRYMAAAGYRVFRISGADVMADPDGAAEGIVAQALAFSGNFRGL